MARYLNSDMKPITEKCLAWYVEHCVNEEPPDRNRSYVLFEFREQGCIRCKIRCIETLEPWKTNNRSLSIMMLDVKKLRKHHAMYL